MRLLLDTHIFLWFISGDPRLPENYLQPIRDPSNDVYLSIVSVWEAAIKHSIGKLPVAEQPGLYFPTQRKRHRIASLALDKSGVARLNDLPDLHRDPFDRMLICQAMDHNLKMVTVDQIVLAYSISFLTP